MRFEAASILFALHKNITANGSKVNCFNPYIVRGLKWNHIDSMSVVGGIGSMCVYSAMLHKLFSKICNGGMPHMANGVTDCSNDETKALLGIWVVHET